MYSKVDEPRPEAPDNVHEGGSSFVSRTKTAERPLLGAVITVPSIRVAQLAARIYDFVMVDMEHSPLSAETATALVHAVTGSSMGNCLTLIRVPSHGVEWAKWALDSGAAGIIVPMVNDATETEGIIQNCLYPPRGSRSFGPLNAPFGAQSSSIDVPKYVEMAHRREIAIIPMIESAQGLENAEAILSVDGVSGIFIGPYDLRLSLGLPGGLDGDEDLFTKALERLCNAGKKSGKPVGSMAIGSKMAGPRTALGMRFLLATLDHSVLVEGFLKDKQEAEDGVASVGRGSFDRCG